MVNSAVLEEYRGQGIYRKLMEMIVGLAVNDGFQNYFPSKSILDFHI